MRNSRHRLLAWLALGPLVSSCYLDVDGPKPGTGLSSEANGYLEQMMFLMRNYSIKRSTANWTLIRTTMFGEAEGARTIPDTFNAITAALTLIGDGHSSYRAVSGQVLYVPNRICSAAPVTAPAVPTNIGYVRVRTFSGSGTAATDYAKALQDSIRVNDRAGLVGWIIDLRGNGGGNMWPMIAGVGPVLGEGLVGHFIDPLNTVSLWEYRDGAALLNGVALARVEQPYTVLQPRPRVAVLTDKVVASSGEATAIAFRDRGDARSFGTATCGLSTANQSFFLSDGATLVLTTSTMADRSRKAYGDVVVPDEVIDDPAQTVARAIAWLQTGR